MYVIKISYNIPFKILLYHDQFKPSLDKDQSGYHHPHTLCLTMKMCLFSYLKLHNILKKM